jgi:hypothetical protein
MIDDAVAQRLQALANEQQVSIDRLLTQLMDDYRVEAPDRATMLEARRRMKGMFVDDEAADFSIRLQC